MPPRKRQPPRRNRVVRVAAGSCVLAAAFLAQYYLANVPTPADIDGTNKFSPAVVRLGQEELVIEEPVSSSDERALLAHDGRKHEAVNVHFDSARLDEQTREDLYFLSPEFDPPRTPEKIDYMTEPWPGPPPAGETCRTFLRIKPGDGQPPRALHLYQREPAGGDHRRHLELKAPGAELVVEMFTLEDEDGTQGCRKLLRIGSLPSLPLPASTQLTAVTSPDSDFRFIFRPLTDDGPSWNPGPQGFLTPFDLGPPPVSRDGKPPFEARAVSIRSRPPASPDAPAVLSARSVDGGPLLRVYDLQVGSDELRVKVSGRGSVSEHGRPTTVDLLKRAQEYPLLAGILTGLNAALLAWFVRLLTGQRRAAK